MRVRDCIVLAQSHPPMRIIQKGLERIRRGIGDYSKKWRDSKRATYVFAIPCEISKLHNYFRLPSDRCLQMKRGEIAAGGQNVLEHRFNLLGSGWTRVTHGMMCVGIEGYRYQMGMRVLADRKGDWLKERINPSNLKMSQRLWGLVDPDYVPIDWHLDFKSGYRWCENTWYRRIPYGHKPGVDIKVPWELTRMQHLPLLAWAYVLAKEGQPGFRPSQSYAREFRNQVLDFVATNPPRFGVNWRSTMDVAIRISNWLVIHDLFGTCGAVFDDPFETTFFQTVYQHGVHIVNNLEWNATLRGNHYLSNIVGLLFVASYLPCTPETNAWLAFAIQELVNEVGYQFNKDGGNFEASSSYHRLSAEMVVYATALTLALPYEKKMALKQYDPDLFKSGPKLRRGPTSLYPLYEGKEITPFPAWYIEKLEKMADFTVHLTKPDGHIPQIGDNDSGRFLKLQPVCHLIEEVDKPGDLTINTDRPEARFDVGKCWDEDHLNHRHLVAAINGLFRREDFAGYIGSGWIESEIVSGLAKGLLLPSYKEKDALTAAELESINEKQDLDPITRENDSQPVAKRQLRKDDDLSRNKLYAYPVTGICVFRSNNIYVAIRCGSPGRNGGHAHNDNLSFELNVRGRDVVVDGGSYLYTPFPDIRNGFRSTKAHNTLILNGLEQNDWADGLVGLFSLRDHARARILKLGTQYLMGEHYGFGPVHRREFRIDGSSLLVEDILEANEASESILNLAPGIEILCLEKHNSEDLVLEMRNAGLHVKVLFKWFKEVEIVGGYFSQGYGNRIKNLLVRGHRSKPHTRLEFDFGEDDG
jgi:hypothetical protein